MVDPDTGSTGKRREIFSLPVFRFRVLIPRMYAIGTGLASCTTARIFFVPGVIFSGGNHLLEIVCRVMGTVPLLYSINNECPRLRNIQYFPIFAKSSGFNP
jgi:hypothetical protein